MNPMLYVSKIRMNIVTSGKAGGAGRDWGGIPASPPLNIGQHIRFRTVSPAHKTLNIYIRKIGRFLIAS